MPLEAALLGAARSIFPLAVAFPQSADYDPHTALSPREPRQFSRSIGKVGAQLFVLTRTSGS